MKAAKRAKKYHQRARRYAVGLAKKATRPERKLRQALEEAGVRHRFQWAIGPYIADFYFPDRRVVVELDGPDHHTRKGWERDQRRTKHLTSQCGIKAVLRYHNSRTDDLEPLLAEIREALDRYPAKPEPMTPDELLRGLLSEITTELEAAERHDPGRGGQHVGTAPLLAGARPSVRAWLERLVKRYGA